ncbi:MAG: hypothetical protein RJB39_654 [Candidatus Parcubacteria bacterium]|jgi:hypothetical protein
MSELTPITEHILPDYFKEGFVYDKHMIDKPASFIFTTHKLGTLPFNTDINIHGVSYLAKKNLSIKNVTVDIAVAQSDFFKSFRPSGSLVAGVRIMLSDARPEILEQKDDIRVDDGQFIVCEFDYVKHSREVEEAHHVGENLYEMLEGEGIAGVSYTKTGDDYHQLLNLDGHMSMEIDAGYGDGTYPLWFAYDKDGSLCAMYIDFLLFERFDIIEKIIQHG